MSKQSRLLFPSAILLLVLLVSLARPMAVYADDTSPPPPATEEPAAPPTEEAPTEAPSEPAPSEATDPAAAPTVEEAGVVADVLEVAPEGTDVVVLNENSEAVPLTSEEAAAIVAVADPMWCPAGVLPGGAGCTTNFASPQALIDDMDLQNPATTNSVYEQAGIIYFTANPGGAFVLVPGTGLALSTSDYNAVKNYNLTLQGGWNGSNDGAGFALSGQTNFGANHVQIGTLNNPWVGNITINNISIDGVTGGANNTLNTGLVVFTAGAINLNEVHSQNNAASGALLDNSSGDKDVTVQNSSFNNNTQNGLRVASKGNITLNGFLASGNNTRGALLDNTSGTGGITSNSSNFSGNGTLGLDALSNGNISLFDVIANENGDSGAVLDNCLEDQVAGICTGTGSITINGSSAGATSFSGNGVNGIEAYSNGDITVNNAAVNGNTEYGASLINDLGEANVFVSNSTFNSNTSTGQDVGLEIFSGGDITLTNVSASNNLAGTGSFLSGSSLLVEHSLFNGNASANPEAGQGMFAEAEEAEMVCSQFSGNSTYGLDASLVLLLTLDDVIFGGNGSGDYLYLGSPFVNTGGCSVDEGGGDEGGVDEGGEEGGDEEGGEDEAEDGEGEDEGGSSENQSLDVIPLTGLSLNIVSVVGSEQIKLDCEAFGGTKLVLPNGDSVILPCPIHDQGSLVGHTQDELPGELDDQFSFLSAMNAGVIRDGQSLPMVDPSIIVKFIIPDGQDSANLAILHWDGSQWVEFPGQVASDGSFDTTTNFTGVFVLVTK